MRPEEQCALSCPNCQQQKPMNALKPGLLQSLPIPSRIWTDLSVDFIGGLSELRGCDSVYAVGDRLSKYAHVSPCSRSITAEEATRLFLNHVWKLHQFPRSIIMDRDPKFVGAFWRAFMPRLKIDHSMTTANRAEADGQTECTSRTLIQYLRLYMHENLSEWLAFLPCAEWVYSIAARSTTCGSPASLVYTEAPLSDPVLDLAVGSQPFSGAGEEFREHLRSARECVRKEQE